MSQQDVVEKKQTAVTETIDIIADLGNKSYKLIVKDNSKNKKIIDCSNAQEVPAGTFGAFVINGKHYIIGENAKSKKNTNKICESKKAVLGRALYPLVQDKAKVDITTLLPLSLYVNEENKRKYSDLLKGKYTVSNSNGATKTFTVSKVDVCAESFSSLLTDSSLLDQPLYLVDIGGVDTTGVFIHKTPAIEKSFFSERGMNIFFTELGRTLTSKLTDSYTEKDAELVFEKYNDLEDSLKAIIDEFATNYVNTNIKEPLKEIGFKSLIHKLVFVGGGSKALERYLIKLDNAQVLENALWSNVEGAQRLSILRGK